MSEILTERDNYSFRAPDTEEFIIFDQDGEIVAATLEKLIEQMTSVKGSTKQKIKILLFIF